MRFKGENKKMKKSSMNIPNILSLIRVCLVPAFVATLIFMRNIEIWGFVIPAVVYISRQ